jgi:splicing factor 3A subunit 3
LTSSILEATRALHEDIELFERAIVQVMLQEPKTQKENLTQAHRVNELIEKIIDRSKKLVAIYKDADGSRKEEINIIGGANQNAFSTFYDRLREIKEYHRKFPNLEPERPEAEQFLNNFDITAEPPVQFTTEEAYGKYLDLHHLYLKYINLNKKTKKNEKIDYITYLSEFYSFEDEEIVKDNKYREYLHELCDYLISFFRRVQPLFDLDKVLNVNEDADDVDKMEITPVSSPTNTTTTTAVANNHTPQHSADYNDNHNRDTNNMSSGETPLFCKFCLKSFTKRILYDSHLKGKKHLKQKEKMKEIWKMEKIVSRMANLLIDQIEATKEHVEAKFSKTLDELLAEQDQQQQGDIDVPEEEEEEIRLTKEHYPIGWDGNPIPYWLYKLNGLGIEYKCEICGNTSYWGRRAYEKHFQEWRHAFGMKCLRLENTKAFHEINKIQDALDLDRKLKQAKKEQSFNPDDEEEFEDSEGRVMNKKVYQDLKRQGLL